MNAKPLTREQLRREREASAKRRAEKLEELRRIRFPEDRDFTRFRVGDDAA